MKYGQVFSEKKEIFPVPTQEMNQRLLYFFFDIEST
jgi:hypothetical protein